MVYVIVLALLVAVVFVVSRPLIRPRNQSAAPANAGAASPERLDLEAARDAKLREIRDAELDHQTGKLSDADYAAVDSTLRSQAIEILHRLDELDGLGGAGHG
jgi:flagellar biosynthesis/type III secretory pathway M-ring protein FliF/YscJ